MATALHPSRLFKYDTYECSQYTFFNSVLYALCSFSCVTVTGYSLVFLPVNFCWVFDWTLLSIELCHTIIIIYESTHALIAECD